MKIIRPHHPLLHQEFEVLKAGQHQLVVQHFDGGVPWYEALDNANNNTTYRETYAANFLNDLGSDLFFLGF